MAFLVGPYLFFQPCHFEVYGLESYRTFLLRVSQGNYIGDCTGDMYSVIY